MDNLTYSNPRMAATIPDWPGGRNKRVTAQFTIEQDAKRGERAVRVTDGAPKKLTFAKMARIVDGSDGRTYIAEFTIYRHISIMKGDMKFQHETIHPEDARYAQALELFAVEPVEAEHPKDCTCRHCEPEPVDGEERFERED
jgi:hypothetical protein